MERMSSPVRVLHVDDEPGFADLVATHLESEHDQLTVHTTTNPNDGLEKLRTTDVDCIVSDHDMPELTGIEFLRAVREQCPNVPFILYTGKGSEEIASEAISNGVTDYLQKEMGTDQYTLLANRIANAVSQYRTERYADAISRRYQALFQQVEAAVAWVEFMAGDPIIQDANPAFKNIFCDTEAGVIGEPIDDFVAVDERQSEATALTEKARTGEYISREVTRAATDGPRTFHAQVIPIPASGDGEIDNAFVLYAASTGTQSDSPTGDPASSQS